MAVPVEIKPNPNIPVLAPGYTVRVHVKVVEGERVRTQVFQGVVIKTRGSNGSFTVRRVAYGVGVERTFPVSSPFIEKVEVVRVGKVRRARLYYLRGLSGKAARLREKRFELEQEVGEVARAGEAGAELPAEEAAAVEAPAAEVETPAAEVASPSSQEASPPAEPSQESAPKQE